MLSDSTDSRVQVQGDTTVQSIIESKKNELTQNTSSVKKNLKLFFCPFATKNTDEKGRISAGMNLLGTSVHVGNPELAIMPYNHRKQEHFSSTLTALMHCYCFST